MNALGLVTSVVVVGAAAVAAARIGRGVSASSGETPTGSTDPDTGPADDADAQDDGRGTVEAARSAGRKAASRNGDGGFSDGPTTAPCGWTPEEGKDPVQSVRAHRRWCDECKELTS